MKAGGAGRRRRRAAGRVPARRRGAAPARSPGLVRVAAAAAALGVAACAAPAERGYYVPDGQPVRPAIGGFLETTPSHQVEVRVQGVYVDEVGGEDVRTVHVQVHLASVQSAPVVIGRDEIAVDLLETVEGAPAVLTLAPAEVWSRRDPVSGDLIAPGFTRQAFDLFFDQAGPWSDVPPGALLVRWGGRAERGTVTGQCRFVRIPPDHPLAPGDEPVADLDYGIRDGYYLPGRVRMGPRRLRAAAHDEQRMHYVFHSPGGWPFR